MPINAAARRDLRRLAPLPRAAPCSKESASNILSSRLKRLVAAGLLTRGEATRGQRAAYSLTEAGIQTLPVMVAMATGARPPRRHPRVRAELLRDGGPELIERFMDELREAHLGIPLSDPDRPRASEQLQAANEAATTGDLDQ